MHCHWDLLEILSDSDDMMSDSFEHGFPEDQLLPLPIHRPVRLLNPRCGSSRLPTISREQTDIWKIAVNGSPDLQLRNAMDEIWELKQLLESNSNKAEKLVKVLLRHKFRLSKALEESETLREADARKHEDDTEVIRLLLDHSRCYIEDLKREAQSPKASIAPPREGPGNEVHASHDETALSQELKVLRDELSKANKTIRDERNVSRALCVQAEGLQRVVRVQHNEIKRRQEINTTMQQLLKTLQDENVQLLIEKEGHKCTIEKQIVESDADQDAAIGEGLALLRERMSTIEEKSQNLVTKMGELVQLAAQKPEDQTNEPETPRKPIANSMEVELGGSKTHTTQPVLDVKGHKSPMLMHARRLRDLQDMRISGQGNFKLPILRLTASPPLQPKDKASNPTTAEATLQDKLAKLEQKNKELEKELRHLRGVDEELTCFHALERETKVPVQSPIPKGSVSSSLLVVPGGDEEIPELRLPSPVSPVKGSQSSSRPGLEP
ncbi:hypothetical protein F4819DRAFT_361678 [Hypoxylon fuscum]|nr:hypothetical protein F4819DRAFT_361678 [Hypoxylon fuscum]